MIIIRGKIIIIRSTAFALKKETFTFTSTLNGPQRLKIYRLNEFCVRSYG